MYFINVLIGWWYDRKYPPRVSIQLFAQFTDSPKVSVTVESRYGCQSVYTFEDKPDGIGRAQAVMYGRSLAFIMRCRLHEEIPNET